MHQPQDEEQDEAEHGEALQGELQQGHGGPRGPAGGHRGLGRESTSSPASDWDQPEERRVRVRLWARRARLVGASRRDSEETAGTSAGQELQ